jgi:hypothetical protein
MANNASVIQGLFPNGLAQIARGAVVQPKTGRPDWVRQRIAHPGAPQVTQRQAAPAGPAVAALQRVSPNGTAIQLPESQSRFATHGGQPMPPTVCQKMERLFGTSFADVRVHIGPHVSSLGARAFTHGSNIHFAPGQYDPQSARGQQTLAHELAHVVQQRSGRVRNPFGSGVAAVHDSALEGEAERFGQRAVMQVIQPSATVRRSNRTPKPKDLSRFEDELPEYRHRAIPTAELKRDIPNFDDGGDRGRPFHPGMRLAGATDAVRYGAYHIADLASLGLLSDIDWYRGAVNRGMSLPRAAAGMAATTVVKAGVGWYLGGLLSTYELGAKALVGAAALATRAGRYAYEFVDSTVAATGLPSPLWETIKTTGRVAIGAEAAEVNANTVMGMSASAAAGRIGKTGATSQVHYEWLHLRARSLGGAGIPGNYVAGSFHANTEMIPLESAIRRAANAGANMEVCITAFCVADSNVANRINYKVWKNGSKAFEKTFDANRGAFSRVESLALEEAANAAFADSWWGSIRRVIGPR